MMNFEKFLPLAYILALGVILYGVYELFFSANAKIPLGAGTPDPGGGAPATSFLGSVLNQFEIGSSPLSMEGSTQSIFSNPLCAIESILGWDSSGDSSTNDDSSSDGSY